MIDQREQALFDSIQQNEDNQKRPIEKYKWDLQDEQQKLVQQILDFVIVCQDKQMPKRRQAKVLFDRYIQETNLKLEELKPRTKKKYAILGLKEEEVDGIKNRIQNIRIEESKYDNPDLRQRINNMPDRTTLKLAELNLTDLDMEVVAQELEKQEINRVSRRLFISHS